MANLSTAGRILAARLGIRRFSPRSRRARALAAAGFAGVSVTLLATELPGSAPLPVRSAGPASVANVLVDGMMAVPVRFADTGSAGWLHPGDRIDVLADTDTAPTTDSVPDALVTPPATPLTPDDRTATDVEVLAAPDNHPPTENSGKPSGYPSHDATDEGGLVFLAVDNSTASRLARAAVHARLSYALHPARPHRLPVVQPTARRGSVSDG